MRDENNEATSREAMKPLTQAEIDRRIGQLASRIAEIADQASSGTAVEAADPRPRWISAADLVKRLAPFMVQN